MITPFEKALQGIDQHVWSSEPEVGEIIGFLIKFNKCKTVVECGTFKGLTSCHIINNLPKGGSFVSIDIEDHRTESVMEYFNDTESLFVKKDSLIAIKEIKKRSVDLIFMDSSHEYEHVVNEFKECERIIKQNGLIIIHDYHSHEGVKRWVDEIKKHSWFEILTLETSRKNGIAIIKCLYV